MSQNEQAGGAAGKIRPSRGWYLLCLAILAVTVALVVHCVRPLVGSMVEALALKHFTAPGRVQANLGKAGNYSIYVQVGYTRRAGPMYYKRTSSPPGLDVNVTRADTKRALPLRRPPGGTRLTVQDRHYVPIRVFNLQQPGTVTISADRQDRAAGPKVNLAIGKTFQAGDVAQSLLRVVLTAVAALVGGGAALTVFLVTLLRRRSARKRLERPAPETVHASARTTSEPPPPPAANA